MDPFETFDVTLFPHRVVLMPAFTSPSYVDVDPDGDLKLLRHLLSSAEMDTLASGLLREYALAWPAVRLEEVEADTHAVVVSRVMEAVEVGGLVGAVADLNDIIRPVRTQEIREIGAQDIVRSSGRGGLTPFYEDKLLMALGMLPDTVAKRISARAAKQLEPFFTGKTLNLTAGVFIVWAGNRSVGTEYVVDGGVLGVVFAYAGWDTWKAFDLIWEFFSRVDAARSEFHIQQAVNHLADAIRFTGVHGFLAMLRCVTPKAEDSSGGGSTGGSGRKRSDLGGGGKAGGTALEDKAKEGGSAKPAAAKPEPAKPAPKPASPGAAPAQKAKPTEPPPATNPTDAQKEAAKRENTDPKWFDKDGNIIWPDEKYGEANGFDAPPTKTTLQTGDTFDRYGGYYDDDGIFQDKGSFVSPDDVPFDSRALLDSTKTKPKKKYVVLKPIPEVETGKAKPWFGKPGGGTQHKLPMSINELKRKGYIREVK